MFSGRFDESYDSNRRVFAVGGYLGRTEDWLALEAKIKRFLEKHDLAYFRASECESGTGVFSCYRQSEDERKPLTDSEKKALRAIKTEFIDITNGCSLWGIGATVLLEHWDSVLAKNPKAKAVLDDPYFLCFQTVICEAATQVNEVNHKVNLPRGLRAEMLHILFDENEEHSGKAKEVYDGFQDKNPDSSECMIELSFDRDDKIVVLQAADNFAYETMKALLNSRYDKERVERKAMTRLKEKTWKIYLFDKPSLEMLVNHNLNREAVEAAVLDQPAEKILRVEG